jgi:UDP:flavonoid glycosyltransferase YjiC (YdhE family)
VSLGVDFQALVESPEGRGALAGNPLDVARLIRYGRSVTREMIEVGGAVATDADVAVCHPKALVAPHVAEATGQPVFLALSLPGIVPTRAFPIPFGVFPDLGPLNPATYWVSRLGALPYHGIVNAWRTERLGLSKRRWWANPYAAHGELLPVLYAFSPTLVPPPPDWPPSTTVTGTWRLSGVTDAPADDGATLPDDLEAFLDAGDPPVYVGFGSMSGQDPAATTSVVLEAVRRAGVRAVLASGWGGLSAADVPPHVHLVDTAPHDALFPRCAAVVHHGGAGTTAAGLRAGRPSVICPFFGDQFFWGRRVHALTAGPEPLPHARLTADRLAARIHEAATSPRLRRHAARLGARLRQERGVARAVERIEDRFGG